MNILIGIVTLLVIVVFVQIVRVSELLGELNKEDVNKVTDRNNTTNGILFLLIGGGFLHIDDNYGMDQYIRLEIKKIFPELDFIEIPHNHHIYNNIYKFDNGLPKIHEHDNKPPQGLALIYNGRIVCFYSYESDLGDGWEDKNVHNDPEYIRQEALKMGANIIAYAMNKKR